MAHIIGTEFGQRVAEETLIMQLSRADATYHTEVAWPDAARAIHGLTPDWRDIMIWGSRHMELHALSLNPHITCKQLMTKWTYLAVTSLPLPKNTVVNVTEAAVIDAAMKADLCTPQLRERMINQRCAHFPSALDMWLHVCRDVKS